MKTLLQLTLFLCLGSSCLYGQTTHNFSAGAAYANSQYYNLATDVTTDVAHTTWDIAFSVIGGTDAGIFINEGASFSGTAPKVYHIPNKTFGDNIVTADLGDELKNTEQSWKEGALNSIKVASNWADYGWGTYNMTNHKVEGTALYAIELPNGTYKKLFIDELAGGSYSFRYADFDGTNLQQKTISKSAYPDQTLAYFSFTTNTTVTVEPATGWDWVFTRYETTLYSSGAPMPYTVTGILTNDKVEIALADGINPATVDPANYTTTADSLTAIGHDWKAYDFSNGWTVDADRVYFVKTADSTLYKIQFVDFQGSSTGQGTFVKTHIGQWTSIESTQKYRLLEQFQAFPNPASDYVNITFTLAQAEENLKIELRDILGRLLVEKTVDAQSGLNGVELNVSSFEAGNYVLTLQSDQVLKSQSILIK
ncbi:MULTISPECIES: T9SS type A sorting domain-containing protein [unclassified Aureispira]|uniref:T9SS type A sorting domain-containing protein n=1 Tax=unclassified Aureispira TaxID=2649989 RepID=UPI000695BB62|nr:MULTISPECIES: T9SS type A sorting domain-containing protein [unclassified Aureispira]WMX13991.1 HmuY family protein [Aureispira sp. CCB-E]